MSTNNTLASQLQAGLADLATVEANIETHLQTLATNQSTALADFKAFLTSNAASQIDPASIAALNDLAAKFGTVDATLTSLANTIHEADPGTAPASPVNG